MYHIYFPCIVSFYLTKQFSLSLYTTSCGINSSINCLKMNVFTYLLISPYEYTLCSQISVRSTTPGTKSTEDTIYLHFMSTFRCIIITNLPPMNHYLHTYNKNGNLLKIVSEYDQEIPQSQTVDKPMVP